MTTPTREQVVQWATDSNGQLIRGAHPGMIGFYPTALENFATLARADLEATIAEKDAEINLLSGSHERSVNLREQLASAQAHIERLREALDAVQQVANRSDGIAGWHLNGDIATWDSILPEVDEALAIPTSRESLRQHDAELVERIAAMFDQPVGSKWIADQIRKGTWE